MYIDKLNGVISQEFFEMKTAEWRKERENILAKIEKQHDADHAYPDEGIRLLEIAQHAVILCEK